MKRIQDARKNRKSSFREENKGAGPRFSFGARRCRSVPVWDYFDPTLFRIMFTLGQKRVSFPDSFSAGTFVSGRWLGG